MSGFDAGWLKLRESADLRARNAELATSVAAHFTSKETLSILDLGCGTGANLRASYALYPKMQHWQLVDHDLAVLDVGNQTLMQWADEARTEADGTLCLKKGGYKLHIKFLQLDLSRDMDGLFQNDPDLVTASALFDLVSDDWLARFVDMITKKRCSVYALLTYDGAEIWQPTLPTRPSMRAFSPINIATRDLVRHSGQMHPPRCVRILKRSGSRLTWLTALGVSRRSVTAT